MSLNLSNMIKRTLYFGNPAYLHKKNKQLKIKVPNVKEELASIPIEDIGIIVLDHQQITVSHSLMQVLLENNVALISCNEHHHPSGMMLNLDGHSSQAERFRIQINASEPLKKNLWQQTVFHKIKNQSQVLSILNKENNRLEILAQQIKSGDSTNTEGRAAAYYWKQLFRDIDFTRSRAGIPPNAHLNYAYSILRATTARALVSSGLLPTLGIFHKNKYNAYALADDIMEPYRPFCDLAIYTLFNQGLIKDNNITKEHKQILLSIPTTDVVSNGKKSPLQIALSRTTSSLVECFDGKRRKIIYPYFDLN